MYYKVYVVMNHWILYECSNNTVKLIYVFSKVIFGKQMAVFINQIQYSWKRHNCLHSCKNNIVRNKQLTNFLLNINSYFGYIFAFSIFNFITIK